MSNNSNHHKKEKKILNVLSLDGGGVRGLIPLRFLQGIEDATGKKVHEIFHTIAGTSTGGFITALLSIPKEGQKLPIEAFEALETYRKEGPNIFPKSVFGFKLYSLFFLLSLFASGFIFFHVRSLRKALPDHQQTHAKLLEVHPWIWTFVILFFICVKLAIIFACLMLRSFFETKYSGRSVFYFCRNHFGEKAKLKDAKVNVGICATDIKKRRSFVFNSLRSKLNHNCLLHSAEIAKIARATSAAPTYFSPEFFRIVPKDDQVLSEEEQKKYTVKVEDLVKEMTPWDSRDKATFYDRKWVGFEDGGTKMNNPSKAALRLAELSLKQEGKNPEDYEIRLLSLGTGSVNGEQEDPTLEYHNGVLHWLGKRGFFGFLDKMNHQEWTGGLLSVIDRRLTGDVFEVLINAHNDHLEVKQQFKENGKEDHYQRQQFKISPYQLDNMDDCSEKNMESLVESAEEVLFGEQPNDKKQWSEKFKKCVEFLDLKIVKKPGKIEEVKKSSENGSTQKKEGTKSKKGKTKEE